MLKTKNRNVAFTITAKNRLPSAMVCRDTFLEYNPNVDFITFFADMVVAEEDIKLLKESAPVIGCHELKRMNAFKLTNKLEEMAYKYDVVEYCTAVKPFCIEYLMWSGYDKVLYFDPDICFFQSVAGLYDILDTYQCVVTPHILEPMPSDGKHQTDVEILSCGVYNLGFGGWSLSQDVVNFLGWWQNQLKHYCFHDVEHHMFVDQYWMDFAPAFLDTFIVKHPGYNAAYWNLHERNPQVKDETWVVNGKPLVFYHYSGLDYFNPRIISIHQNRFDLENRPELSKLFFEYMKKLYKYNALEYINLPYYYDKAGDTKLDKSRKFKYVDTFKQVANPWVADKQKLKDSTVNQYGLNIIGYFPYVSGVADTARNLVQKIYSTGIPYSLYPVVTQKPLINTDENYQYALYYASVPAYDTSIFCVNLDQIGAVQEAARFLQTKRNVGIFWWEIEDDLPFQENFSCVDEVICFTKFTYDIFTQFAPKGVRVHKLAYPFIAPKQGTYNEDIEYCRKRIGIFPTDFVFLCCFDYASSYERKNPVGVLKAFSRAFKGNKEVKLLVKTLNDDLYPNEVNNFDFTCKTLGVDKQTVMVNGPLSKIDLYALTNMCDVYVSLHRSEGCGIGMMEAMCFGKPVIATGYSGNLEFMNSQNSLLVDYKKVTIDKDTFKVYKKNSTWAEPNLEDASAKMIKLYENVILRTQIGKQARGSIVEYADLFKWNKAFYNFMLGDK